MKPRESQNAHFPFLDLGGGGGYKFPIHFVQDCSLCNALIENKTRMALIAFSKKKKMWKQREAEGWTRKNIVMSTE